MSIIKSEEWVECPVCSDCDMLKTTSIDGDVIINCTNHACLSNGGDYIDPKVLERLTRNAHQSVQNCNNCLLFDDGTWYIQACRLPLPPSKFATLHFRVISRNDEAKPLLMFAKVVDVLLYPIDGRFDVVCDAQIGFPKEELGRYGWRQLDKEEAKKMGL